MGTWGYKVQECDTFADAIEQFQTLMDRNLSNEDARKKLLDEYSDSPEGYIAELAMAYCFAMHGGLDDVSIKTLIQIVDSNIDEEHWKKCGATKEQLAERRKWLLLFVKDILNSSAKKTEPILRDVNRSCLKKGDVFYYRSNKITYGAVVLDILKGFYLIAVSEKIHDKPTFLQIMSSPLYTLSWFSDVELLNNKRVHICSNINTGDYNGRAGGIFYKDGAFNISNCGDIAVWKHNDRRYYLKNVSIEYVCTEKNVPMCCNCNM